MDAITENEGEDRARDYLEDGELWKDAVQHDRTTSNMEDWIEDVLNIDGWQTTLGDMNEVGIFDGEMLYVRLNGCGAILDPAKSLTCDKLLVSKEDLDIIVKSDSLHCKEFRKMTKQDRKLLDQVVAVFMKYPKFDLEQLGIYAHCYRVQGDFNIEDL
jgi:hypothetical protein